MESTAKLESAPMAGGGLIAVDEQKDAGASTPESRISQKDRLAVERIASSAHQAVDRIAHAASQAAEKIDEKSRLVKDARTKAMESGRDFIKENPATAVGVAAGLAFAAGFLLRHVLRLR